MELLYNNGIPFPTALKELLFLAGDDCYVLDYGLTTDRKEMQDDARLWLSEFNRNITRPFFVIDIYNAGDQFLFVYLDEHPQDPTVYSAYLPEQTYEALPWIHSLNNKLSEFINYRIEKTKSGLNPF